MKIYAVIGLGYVGLGLAIALSKKRQVFGYDVNRDRIQELSQHQDKNLLFTPEELAMAPITYTHKIAEIKKANFYIIAVPTPAYFYETPELTPLIDATKEIAIVLKKGDIVVYESTVYPGTTEEICIPILEKEAQLKNGKDFYVGYSPERISPGDKTHTLQTITKIVSAQDTQTLKIIKETYELICDKVYPVSCIPAAEASKILENTQRDVNIALMNEFTQIMHAMNLNTHEIIEAAKTKFGFVSYKPGLVGGHCISIDPYYLAFKAKRVGVYPELVLSARRVNDTMPEFIIQSMMRLIIANKVDVNNLSIGLFGISYKDNVVDIRNSLVLKLIRDLKRSHFHCRIHDPYEHSTIKSEYPMHLERFEDINDLSVIIVAVNDDFYKKIGLQGLLQKCKKPAIIMDLTNLFAEEASSCEHLVYWSL